MSRASTLAPVLGLVLAGSLLTSCAGWNPFLAGGQTEKAKLEEERRQLQLEREQVQQERQKVDQERRKADETVKKQAATSQDLEEQLARARMSLLEKEAQVKLLTQKLDAAILEVVRSMAKLRTLESRAEAASNLAETEIALKVVESDSPGRGKPPDAAQAEKLLTVAGQEFQKENYGGALYLTTQAKGLLKSGATGRGPGSESLPKVDGEVAFSLPLPLRVLSRGTVREGPGHNFKVSFPVAEGAAVTGHSYKGMWVRVRNDEGRLGWIFYSQVGQR
jgi:hypothetical protein